ncbi:MAG TPA: TonB-dependent receptor [Bryobacteraceae bacterium]|nr:TonB-dependent receptor [Bryobacteraceae bacterium]
MPKAKRIVCFSSFAPLAMVLVLAGPALAQDYRGTVQGVVTDPSHAAIAGAKVSLKNPNTGLDTVRVTDTTGHYLFNFVQPGTYSLSVEAAGFQHFVQEGVTVLTRGDVTVDAALTVGAVAETVNVTEEVGQVQFNTSTMTTTVQGSMLKDLPVLARNPFTLALLNPAVVNKYWDVAHRNPFYMWSNGGMDIGGPTGGKNEQLLDGTTLNISARGSYNAPMDAVQEVAIQQNAMDAEYGFSAGGTLNLSMKSGTNDFHGTAYYFGRNPALNALANRITRNENIIRQNIWGGTIGHPIIKNKLFNFFSYEQWRTTQPSSNVSTVPTAAERNGDFSHSLTPQGGLRTIYDPFTTQFDPATSAVTRQPFPGNIIPSNRMDPSGKKALADLWMPNNPGDDLSGINNFKTAYAWWIKYWNLSDRVDYNINDRWRMFARFSKFQTRLDNPNWGGTIAVPSDNGGIMDAMNAAIDVLWMATPRTTVDFRFGSTYDEDDYASQWAQVPTSVWAGFYPTGWYKDVLQPTQGIYYPRFNFSGNGSAYTGIGGWWLVHGRSHNPTVDVTHDVGKHHLKAGWQLRYSYDQDNASSGPGSMSFNAIDTGSTFLSNYNPALSGNMYASALLGVLNSGNAHIAPNLDMHQQQWAYYFQDDIRLTRDITLNLGLRWERETAPAEETRMLVQTLDLTNPIPELQGITMPSQVTSVAKVPYKFNGAMVYTSNSQPRMYDAPWTTFLPRAGIAIRLNDRTAFRAGWARYAVPWVTIHPETGGLPTNGFSQNTYVLGPLQGVPRALLSDPFPSSNPVLLPVGNTLGRYQDLGNGIAFWDGNNLQTPMNDRINFTIQRQAPQRIFAEATFFMMFGHNVQDPSMWGGNYSYNLNQMDPNLAYTYKGLVDQSVPNPFYNLLPADKMPGTLRTQPTVSVRQLLTPYPQYGALTEYGWPGNTDHYYAVQMQAQRPMANGLTFLVAYNYSHETHGQFFNDIDLYANRLTMLDRMQPRHNIRIAGTWELPFGRGRRFLSNANPLVDAVLGGWATSHIFMWRNGNLLNFGAAQVSGDPTQSVPAGLYFNPSVFSVLPAYTPRTNPWYYDGLRGPGFWQLDSTLVKYFKITERVKFELRMEFYNLPNAFMPSDPNLGVGSGTMGRSTWVAGGNYGREIQYTGRIHF